jgi:hypothetical protein
MVNSQQIIPTEKNMNIEKLKGRENDCNIEIVSCECIRNLKTIKVLLVSNMSVGLRRT